MHNLLPHSQLTSGDRALGLLRGSAAGSRLARGVDPVEPGSESALQISILDGLLDAMEWANAGVGADDVACLWLGALRWVKAINGQVPDGAPQPPARPVTTALGRVSKDAGGDPQNLIGLLSPEMSQPRRPFNRPAPTVPELASTDGPGVLARGAALGILVHAAEDDVIRLATAAAAFSHGSRAAHSAAASAAALLYFGLLPESDLAAVTDAARRVSQSFPDATPGGAQEALTLGAATLTLALEAVATGEDAWAPIAALAAGGSEGAEQAALLAGACLGAWFGTEAVPTGDGPGEEASIMLAERLGKLLG